eukprot:TRINITY_DN1979_c0_g1_i1.p1 TRINITY_DN1979_c0_g1~~TRINITY_DN1979_c0_g1_i1.p1  ORF type:complete len:269 (+),score=137.47 TRINITY_DN1979_c0_g1_i1:104-910(+)
MDSNSNFATKEEAIEITAEQLSNPKKMAEGIVLFQKMDRNDKKNAKKDPKDVAKGRVVFSLKELPLKVVFATEYDITVERISENSVRVGGKKTIEAVETPAEVLNSPPPSSSLFDSVLGFFSADKNAVGTAPKPAEKPQTNESGGFFGSFFGNKEETTEPAAQNKSGKEEKTEEKSKEREENKDKERGKERSNSKSKKKSKNEPKEEPTFFSKAMATITGEEEQKKKEKQTMGQKISKTTKNTQKKVKTKIAKMAVQNAFDSAMKGIV